MAGDFYDVFEIGEGSWLAIVGDVCGKGVDAAAVMALARYTVRTAALTQARPSGILATLNEALLRADLDRFCTACAVRIDRPTEENAPIEITLASGGHPQPVLIEDDRATPVQVFGTLLGYGPVLSVWRFLTLLGVYVMIGVVALGAAELGRVERRG